MGTLERLQKLRNKGHNPTLQNREAVLAYPSNENRGMVDDTCDEATIPPKANKPEDNIRSGALKKWYMLWKAKQDKWHNKNMTAKLAFNPNLAQGIPKKDDFPGIPTTKDPGKDFPGIPDNRPTYENNPSPLVDSSTEGNEVIPDTPATPKADLGKWHKLITGVAGKAGNDLLKGTGLQDIGRGIGKINAGVNAGRADTTYTGIKKVGQGVGKVGSTALKGATYPLRAVYNAVRGMGNYGGINNLGKIRRAFGPNNIDQQTVRNTRGRPKFIIDAQGNRRKMSLNQYPYGLIKLKKLIDG